MRPALCGASFAVDVLTVDVMDPELGPVDYLDSELSVTTDRAEDDEQSDCLQHYFECQS